jgi:hypothetical protein
VRCAECPQRRFLPVSDVAIRGHLSGQDGAGRDVVLGVYPLLLDEACYVLAADFDKGSWRDDASAFRSTCREMGLSAALERSRSGQGAHVWFFFQEAIPAVLARKLAAHVLTETMERRPEVGLDSYDRFFPNQDTLPKGGLGNLIALPLQKRARQHGNSVFLDEQLRPWPDQWAFLAALEKIGRAQAEEIVRQAESRGRVLGVRLAVTLAYLKYTQARVHESLAAETTRSLAAPAGFSWLKMTRAEVPMYSMRHVQHHIGQLSAYLRRASVKPKWTKGGVAK